MLSRRRFLIGTVGTGVALATRGFAPAAAEPAPRRLIVDSQIHMWPANTPERLRYTYWLHFAEGTMQPQLLLKLLFNRIETGPMPFFVRPIARGISHKVKSTFIDPNLVRQFDYVESELGRSAWFAGGELSGADVQMSFPLEAAASRGGLDGKWPRIVVFLERIHARPAYRKAIERGGEYALMK